MYVALGRWRWTDFEGGKCWSPPAGAVAALDLRSLPQQDIAGGTGGFGLFGFDTDPGAGVLGEDPEGVVGPTRRQALADALGVEISSARLGNIVAELLTARADPTGQAFARPIMPDRDGLTLRFGTIARREAFDLKHPHAAKVLGVLREDYRAIRARGGPHRKFLGALLRKYRTSDYRQFQPADLPDEEPIEPTTTITESFNTADSATLGPDLSWTEVSGVYEVLSNQCRGTSDGSVVRSARAESDLSSADHYSQIDAIANSGANTGLFICCFRFESAANTYYRYITRMSDGLNQLQKVVTGTPTNLVTGTTSALSLPDTLRGDVSGSTLTGYRNGASTATVSDTAITGHLRCGLGIQNVTGGSGDVDNFEASDGLSIVQLVGRRANHPGLIGTRLAS